MIPQGAGISKAKLSMATPAAELRYVTRAVPIGKDIAEMRQVLQQLWNITETEGGYPIKGRTEWRDVPVVG